MLADLQSDHLGLGVLQLLEEKGEQTREFHILGHLVFIKKKERFIKLAKLCLKFLCRDSLGSR